MLYSGRENGFQKDFLFFTLYFNIFKSLAILTNSSFIAAEAPEFPDPFTLKE